MNNLGDGANYAWFNDITYVRPKVPTLFTALTTGEFANNATVYGRDTNSFVLQKNDVIEIILNNDDPGKHREWPSPDTMQQLIETADLSSNSVPLARPQFSSCV